MLDRTNITVPDDQHYRRAMQCAGTGMAILDLEGRWVDVNPALARMLGHDAAALIGRPAAQFAHADDADAARAGLAAVAGDETPTSQWQQRYRRIDADSFWAQVEVASLRDASGAPCYLVMHVHDIDAQRRNERTLRQQLAERTATAQALVREQEVFAYGISHDLRAPLRAINSFAELLDRHVGVALDDSGRDYLQRIRAAATRMGGLIDVLLDLSRIDRAELAPVPVDLGLFAELAIAELQEAEPARTVEIEVAPDLIALGDERQLRMLITQLLHNAWKFSDTRAPVRIQVGGEREGDLLHVAVRDYGSGFDMRYAEKLFEPFQRLHAPEQGSGNGIGLAIARRIVERHGGRLWAQSEPGAGSSFHFELPAPPAATKTAERNA